MTALVGGRPVTALLVAVFAVCAAAQTAWLTARTRTDRETLLALFGAALSFAALLVLLALGSQ